MEFLSSISGGAGSSGQAFSQKIASQVAKIVNAQLPSERRDAGEELQGMVNNAPQGAQVKRAIGAQMYQLIGILGNSKEHLDDDEFGQTIVEIIHKGLVTENIDESQIQPNTVGPGTISGTGTVSFDGIQVPLENTNMLLENQNYVNALLEVLVQPLQYTRLGVIDILLTCLQNAREKTEKAIEAAPAGMERLVDVLNDSNDAVRNDMLNVLGVLTEKNEFWQNFVAFRDGFAKLIFIIEEEMKYGSNLIAHTCLVIMNNILKGNMQTQRLFVDGKHLARLTGILELPRETKRSQSNDFSHGMLDSPGLSDDDKVKGGDGDDGVDGDDGYAKGDSGNGPASPKSAVEVAVSCEPARKEIIGEGLELISILISGLCSREIITQPWFDPEEEYILDRSFPDFAFDLTTRQQSSGSNQEDAAMIDELRRRHKIHLTNMQNEVGKMDHLILAIAQIALCLPPGESDQLGRYNSFGDISDDPESERTTWAQLREQALYLLGDLVCGNESIALSLLGLQLIAPRNSILATTTCQVLELHNLGTDHRKKGSNSQKSSPSTAHLGQRPGKQLVSIRSTIIAGILQLAIHGETVEEKAASAYFWECLLHKNENVQIALLGHAITLPPDDVSDETFTSKVAPPAGRLLVDTLLSACSYSLHGEFSSEPSSGLINDDLDSVSDLEDPLSSPETLRDILVRSSRLFEKLLKHNPAAQELALRVPFHVKDAGFRNNSFSMMVPRVDDVVDGNHGQNDDEEQDEEEEYKGEMFTCFVHDLVQIIRKYYQAPSLDLVKSGAVSMLRVLFFWLDGALPVAKKLLSCPSGLVLFDVASRNPQALDPDVKSKIDVDLEGLSCACIGLCLKALYHEYSNPASRKAAPRSTGDGHQQDLDAIRLLNLISRKISLEAFSERMGALRNSADFQRSGMSKRAKERNTTKRRKQLIANGDLNEAEHILLYDLLFFGSFKFAEEEIQQVIIKTYSVDLPQQEGDDILASDLAADIETLREKYSTQYTFANGLKNIIRDLDSEVRALKTKLQAYSVDSDSKDAAISGSSGSIKTNFVDSEQLEALQRQNDNLVQEKHDLEQEMLSLGSKLEESNLKFEESEKKRKDAESQYQQLLATSEDLQVQVQQLEQQQQQQPQHPQHQQYSYDIQNANGYSEVQVQQDQTGYDPNYYNQDDQPQQEAVYYDNYNNNLAQDNQYMQEQQVYDENSSYNTNNNGAVMQQDYQYQQPQQEYQPTVLDFVLEWIVDFPNTQVLCSLPVLMEAAARKGYCSPGDVPDWLERAADVASTWSEYETAIKLLEMIPNKSEACLEKLQDMRSRPVLDKNRAQGSEEVQQQQQRKGEEQADDNEEQEEEGQGHEQQEDFRALQREHSEVLLLLAKQELDKKLLMDKVRELGGEEQLDLVRAKTFEHLMQTFSN